MTSRLYLTARMVCSAPAKPCISIPAVKRSMASMFSMISLNRWTGSLEGTHDLAGRALPRPRPQRAFLNQINRMPEKVRNPVLDPDHIEQGQALRVIERGQQIDIGIRPRLIP